MDTIKIENLQYITIGVQGEHNAETVPIDMTSWVEEFAEKEIEGVSYYILFKPYDSTVALPVVTEWSPDEDNILRWTITLSNTYTAGVGYAEVRAIRFNSVENDGLELGIVKKSKVIPVTVGASVTGVEGGTVPAPYDDWVNLVLQTKEQLNTMFEGAVTEYQGSNSGTEIPTGAWSTTPDLTKNYMWSRIDFEWSTGSHSYFYTVSYLGLEEAGVQEINGITGSVTLTGANIQEGATAPTGSVQAKLNNHASLISAIQSNLSTVQSNLSTVQGNVSTLQGNVSTLQGNVSTLQSNVSTLQSGKLDSSKIVYSSAEPAKVAGTIWLKPKG